MLLTRTNMGFRYHCYEYFIFIVAMSDVAHANLAYERHQTSEQQKKNMSRLSGRLWKTK